MACQEVDCTLRASLDAGSGSELLCGARGVFLSMVTPLMIVVEDVGDGGREVSKVTR